MKKTSVTYSTNPFPARSEPESTITPPLNVDCDIFDNVHNKNDEISAFILEIWIFFLDQELYWRVAAKK